MTDDTIREAYSSLKRVKWHDYEGRDEGFEWYYAEKRLYIIRCKATGMLYMTHAGSPDQAMVTYREALMLYSAAMLDELQAAQPKAQGRWLHVSTTKGSRFACSECGKEAYYPQATRSKGVGLRMPYTHCPYCLAEMEVEWND